MSKDTQLIQQSSILGRIQQAISKCSTDETLKIIGSVFMTFNLETIIFEENILPSIFGIEEATIRPARMQLLRSYIAESALPVIFYDEISAKSMGISNERYTYIPVKNNDSFQHAKHVFLLLAPEGKQEATHLIFLTISANLTKAGWYRNIEFADIEILRKDSSHPLKSGLLRIYNQLEYWVKQVSLDSNILRSMQKLKQFIAGLSEKKGYPVLWTGKESLSEFFQHHVNNQKVKRLTIGAPYVSENAKPIINLYQSLKPQNLQVLCPSKDGKASASKKWFDIVKQLPATLHYIAKLDSMKLERRLHAKFYFIELKGRTLVGIGSPNLSKEGMAKFTNKRRRSHYETLILRESSQWWNVLDSQEIQTIPEDSQHYAEEEEDLIDDIKMSTCRILLDWKTNRASIFQLASVSKKNVCKNISCYLSEEPENRIQCDELSDERTELSEEYSTKIFKWFETTPTLKISYDGLKKEQLILIIETNVSHAPPKNEITLDVSDYLSYWKTHFLSGSKSIQRSIERQFNQIDQRNREEDKSLKKDKSQNNFMHYSVAILNSFDGLRFRCQKAIKTRNITELKALLINRNSLSLLRLLENVVQNPETMELNDADALVVWLSATTLWNSIPEDIKEEFSTLGSEVESLLKILGEKWQTSELEDAESLKNWILDEWDWPKDTSNNEDLI